MAVVLSSVQSYRDESKFETIHWFVLYSAQFAKAQSSSQLSDVNDIADYPYLAFVEDSQTGYSGNGAIISDTHVITSASALNPAPGVKINVYVGNAVRRAGTLFKSKNFQKHPKYNSSNVDNNVAIITINGTFKGLPNVKPIGIRTSAFKNPVSCFSVGWGIYVNTGIRTPRRINYQLVTDRECATKLGPQPSTTQCAGAKEGCGFFEIGGIPLVCDHQLYGILPTVFSRVTYFTDAQPIDIFAKLTAASIQDFVFRIVPRTKHEDGGKKRH